MGFAQTNICPTIVPPYPRHNFSPEIQKNFMCHSTSVVTDIKAKCQMSAMTDNTKFVWT